MKASELRQLTQEELEARVKDLRNDLFNLKLKHATGQLEDSAGLLHGRRILARALSIRSERRKTSD